MIYEYFDGDLIKCGMKLKKNIYLAIYQYDIIMEFKTNLKYWSGFFSRNTSRKGDNNMERADRWTSWRWKRIFLKNIWLALWYVKDKSMAMDQIYTILSYIFGHCRMSTWLLFFVLSGWSKRRRAKNKEQWLWW